MKKNKKRLTGTVFFESGRGNTMDIIFPEVVGLDFFIHFRPTKEFNGEFGFDYVRDNFKTNCNNFEKLKTEYKKIENTEYFIPWLSLNPGQEINLTLKLETLYDDLDEDKIVSFPSKNGISFILNEKSEIGKTNKIKVSEINETSIKIVCEKTILETTTIEITDENEFIVGAINFTETKKVIEIPIDFVLVSEKKHINNLREKFETLFTELEDFLQKKSFNQAFIKPYFTNNLKNCPIFSLDDFEPENFSNNGISLNKKGEKLIERKYDNQIKKDKGITIFIVGKNHVRNQAGSTKIAPLDYRKIFMFLNTGQKTDFIHEIGHLLGLTHTFTENHEYDRTEKSLNSLLKNESDLKTNKKALNKKLNSEDRAKVEKYVSISERNIKLINEKFKVGDKNPHKFKISSTTCFMDYYNEGKDFYKWQWEVMYSEAKKYYSK